MTRYFIPLLGSLLAAGVAHGAECLDAAVAKDGFVLERPGIRSVFQPSAEVVQVINTFESSPRQTQFFVGGLVEVFRTSETGQFAMLPFFDLRGIFPLKPDAHHEVAFIRLVPEEKTGKPETLELEVTGKETLSLGECKYEVLAVKQTTRTHDGKELDVWTALYAPDLQAILAKRYDEGTNKESTIAYDTIKPLTK